MEKIDIAATARTPLLSFDPATGQFLLEGESYPEDTKKFYDAPLSHVYSFFGGVCSFESCVFFQIEIFQQLIRQSFDGFVFGHRRIGLTW